MNLVKTVDWIPEFFHQNSQRVDRILSAGGCRELWLQGEMYLFLNEDELRTNATKKKYDLYKEGCFVIELKLLGGNYQRKVLGYLKKDFDKLHAHLGTEKRYVLLVLDNSCQDSQLYDELFNYQSELAKQIYHKDYGGFCVILWRLI